MNTISTFTLTTLLVLGGAGAAAAQQPSSMDSTQKQVPAYQRTVPDSLLAQVKVSEDSARGLAFTRVPGGSVQGLVLHRERGRLIWTFAIARREARHGGSERERLDGRILKVEQRSS
jgi:hypothetical protein